MEWDKSVIVLHSRFVPINFLFIEHIRDFNCIYGETRIHVFNIEMSKIIFKELKIGSVGAPVGFCFC